MALTQGRSGESANGQRFCGQGLLEQKGDGHMGTGSLGVGPHIGVRPRPFPKPILEAIELLRDRTIDRWLEWQPDKNWSTKMALTQMTSGERKPSARRLWGTWQRHEAAGMEWALKQVGVQVFGGRDWELDWYNGEQFAVWYLPTEAMPDEEMPDTTTVDTGRSLLSVFAS